MSRSGLWEVKVQDTAYELLSMGMRYVFILLMLLFLLRAYVLMRRGSRAWRRALRNLPDAGLVGELVDVTENRGYPLPREGLIGSGRSCDIRLPGLRWREFHFVFRPGHGVCLMPIHQRNGALLDGEPLKRGNEFALHGTILEIRGLSCRFRLFAGLDLPARQRTAQANVLREAEPAPWPGIETAPQPLPPGAPPEGGMDLTWQYAPLPGPDMIPQETPPGDLDGGGAPRRRRRLHRRKGNGQDIDEG